MPYERRGCVSDRKPETRYFALRRLLPANDLTPEDRARLVRLRNNAEAELARLTYAEAA